MISTSTSHIRARFRDHRLLQVLLGTYALVWVITAVAPLDRHDWFLENLLVFAVMALLVGTYRVFPLSALSYLLITTFLTLHANGAHYTYSEVPLGFWIQRTFGFARNPFDRVVHFSFGLLLAYPIREVFAPCTRSWRWSSRRWWRRERGTPGSAHKATFGTRRRTWDWRRWARYSVCA